MGCTAPGFLDSGAASRGHTPHTVNIEGDSYWLREKKKFSRLGRKPKLAVELEEEVGTEA